MAKQLNISQCVLEWFFITPFLSTSQLIVGVIYRYRQKQYPFHGFEFDISSAIFSSYNHCLRHEIFVLPKTFTRKNNTSKLLTETTRHDEKKFKDFHKVHVFFSSLLKLKRNFSVIFFINKYLPCRNNGLFTILVYTLLDKSFVKCYISDQTSVPIDYILRRS